MTRASNKYIAFLKTQNLNKHTKAHATGACFIFLKVLESKVYIDYWVTICIQLIAQFRIFPRSRSSSETSASADPEGGGGGGGNRGPDPSWKITSYVGFVL